MKKTGILIGLVICGLFCSFRASAQSAEIQQLLLNVEKLTQFKQILSDMKKGYQILEGGYNTIKDISEGNFSLHKAFLDGLMEVSPTVRNYKRVGDIVNYQIILVREYRNAYDRFQSDGNLRNLDELLVIITAGKARMSDDERLQAIDRIYADMQDKLMFLRHFNNNTTILAVQRAKERNDARTIRNIYGINN